MKIISDLLFVGKTLSESAAATWTTDEIDLATAIREGIGAVIVGCDMRLKRPIDVGPAGTDIEYTKGFLLEEDKASEITPEDPDVIGYVAREHQGDATDNILETYTQLGYAGKIVRPEEGYKTGRQKIFLGIISSNAASAGFVNLKLYYYMAHFTQSELVDLGFRESFE